MANTEQITFLMGDELKLAFSLDYSANTLALSVLQRIEPGEGEEDEWNMLSKVFYRSDHPTKLMRQLKELVPIDGKAE